MATPSKPLSLPITGETVLELYDWLFAPWVNVLRFGKSSAFAEAKVTFLTSGELVAHATLEFAF